MLIHSVFFWLNPQLNSPARKEFVKGLKSLKKIEQVKKIFIGPPAKTDRPAVDRTYSYALTILFENLKGHDIYQSHALHKDFLSRFSSYWLKVVIYDSQTETKNFNDK